jgi:hypothetical protein
VSTVEKQHSPGRVVVALASVVAGACALITSPAARAEDAPVPPNVEQPAVAAQGGMYCYGGPHPVDTRVAAGGPWDQTQGPHSHTYPPFDLRLFAFKDGCYHFVGDPRDFGYQGQTYSYYGAHPVMDVYGGGWCFMVGGHAHWWRPWSPYFVMTGPWFYWYGPYDAFFWSYWPYYATYYRTHYPHYYGGGRWRHGAMAHGGRGWTAAPPVGRVPAPPARAMASGTAMTGASTGMAPSPTTARPARGAALPRTDSWSGQSQGWSTATPWNGYQAAPRRADAPAFRSAPVSPGFRSSPAPAPAPAPGYRSTPMRSDSQFRSAPTWGGGGGSRPVSPSFGGGGGRWRGR